MAKFVVRLGKTSKYNFHEEFSTKEEAKEVLNNFAKFYNDYAKTHVISARTWTSPIVYVNMKPAYYVSPNGSLATLSDEKVAKINEYNKNNSDFATCLSQVR